MSRLVAAGGAQEAKGERKQATSNYDAALGVVVESDCGSPRDASPAVEGLARLAVVEISAQKALSLRRSTLQRQLEELAPTTNANQVVAFGLICESTHRWDLVAELLRTLRGRGKQARSLRVALLAWGIGRVKFQQEYALVAEEQEQLRIFLTNDLQLALREEKEVLETSMLLYEAFLREGKLGDAHRIAEKVISSQPHPQVYEQFGRVAASAGSSEEVQRLRSDAGRMSAAQRLEAERLLDGLELQPQQSDQ